MKEDSPQKNVEHNLNMFGIRLREKQKTTHTCTH